MSPLFWWLLGLFTLLSVILFAVTAEIPMSPPVTARVTSPGPISDGAVMDSCLVADEYVVERLDIDGNWSGDAADGFRSYGGAYRFAIDELHFPESGYGITWRVTAAGEEVVPE